MKLKKNLINTLEEMTLLALFICIFVRAFLFLIGVDVWIR